MQWTEGVLPFRSFLFSSQWSTKPFVSELLPGCFSKGRGGTAVNNRHRRSTPGCNRKCWRVAMQLCSPSARTLGSLLTNGVWWGQYGRLFEQPLQKLYSQNRSRAGWNREWESVIVCPWLQSGVRFMASSPSFLFGYLCSHFTFSTPLPGSVPPSPAFPVPATFFLLCYLCLSPLFPFLTFCFAIHYCCFSFHPCLFVCQEDYTKKPISPNSFAPNLVKGQATGQSRTY